MDDSHSQRVANETRWWMLTYWTHSTGDSAVASVCNEGIDSTVDPLHPLTLLPRRHECELCQAIVE